MEVLLNTYTQEMTLREQMLERLKELCCSKQEAAMQMGVSRPALSQYLNEKYQSNPTELEEKIRLFLEETAIDEIPVRPEGENPESAPVAQLVWSKISNFESRDYIQAMGLLKACQDQCRQGIIVGRSGQGKTHTLKQYAKLPRTAYIECNEAMNAKDLVRKIERALGFPKAYGSIDERLEGVAEFLNVTPGYLLIVDEADKLITKYTQKKMELLRSLSDMARVGIVLAGEPILESMLKAYDERYANRMSFYYQFNGLLRSEVEGYLKGFRVDEDAMNEFLVRATNNKNGCFRLLDRTLDNVIRILKDRGQDRVTLKVINEASGLMMF